MKTLINEVLYLLEDEGIDAEYTDGVIQWKNQLNDTHYIRENEIVKKGQQLAWFETRESEVTSLLRYFHGNLNINWTPESNHIDWGIQCHDLSFIDDYLRFVYTEKHGTYVCTIHNDLVRNSVRIYPDKMAKKGNTLYSKIPSWVNKNANKIIAFDLPKMNKTEYLESSDLLNIGVVLKPFGGLD